MAGTQGAVYQLEKLRGASNYLAWCARVRAVLVQQELASCLETAPSSPEERKKDEKARSVIVLAVDDRHLCYLNEEPDARSCWIRLRNLYQRKTACNRVMLARKLFCLRLNDLEEREAHCSRMLSLFQDMSTRGLNFTDEQRGIILLSSLGDKFLSFVECMQSVPEADLTFDYVGERLCSFEAFKATVKLNSESLKMQTESQRVGECSSVLSLVCYRCQGSGHFARQCPSKPRPSVGKQASSSGKSARPSGKPASRTPVSRSRRKQSSCDEPFCMSVTVQNDECDVQNFLLDSGSTQIFCNNPNVLKNKVSVTGQVAKLANGQQVKVVAKGDVEIPQLGGLKIENALCVPQLQFNVLSVSALTEMGFSVCFEQGSCLIKHNQTGQCYKTFLQDGLYFLSASECGVANALQTNALHRDDCVHLAHRKIGHLGFEVLRKTLEVTDLKVSKCPTYLSCAVCNRTKLKAYPVPKTSSRVSSQRLELVHLDVAGPYPTSIGLNRFLLVIVDDYSRLSFVMPMKHKHEVFHKFSVWLRRMQTQYAETPVKQIQTDRGGEFLNKNMFDLLKRHGIIHRKTNPYCSRENGVAERKIGSLQSVMTAMLEDAQMSKGLWAEAICTANVVLNRVWSSSVQQTPYYMFFGKKPDIKYFQVFGAYANVLIPKEKRGKRDQAWQRLRFIGYEMGTKGYRFWCGGKKIVVSRSVRFENHTNWPHIHANTEVFFSPNTHSVKEESDESESSSLQSEDESEDEVEETQASQREVVKEERHSVSASDTFANMQPSTSTSDATVSTRKHKRKLAQSREDDASEEEEEESSDSAVPRRSKRSTKGVPPQRLQVSQIASEEWREPITYADVLRRPKEEKERWLEAMKKEFNSLQSLQVLEPAKVPPDTKLVGCRWVFKRKTQLDGQHIFRARLVAQGYSQVYLENFDEVYAPTVRPETVRLALGLGFKRNYVMKHFDIETAYLNADLSEQVYMRPIPGFESDTSTGAYRLKKALYGLKQSARNWNQCLDQKLQSLGFVRSSVDACLYKRGNKHNMVYVLVFVDDLLVMAENNKLIDNVYKGLCSSLKVKDLGEVRKYLGVEINRSQNGLELSQKEKILSLLEKTRMSQCKPVNTPMLPEFLKQEQGDMFQNQSLYRSVIGSLLYLANWTRPDIAYAVNVLSRRVQSPSSSDWQAVKRVLRFLKGTSDKVLRICPNDSGLKSCVDSSFGDCEQNRSCTGYLICYSGIHVTWKSRKQKNVSLSTAEAEFSALSENCTEIEWVQSLVQEFEACNQPVPVYCDSQTCIEMAKTDNLKSRTKYVGVRYENVRNMVSNGVIKLVYVPTEQNVADMLTKSMSVQKLQKFSRMIHLM